MRIGLVRRVGRVCAAEATGGSSRMVNRVGGGIFALRRPRPYSRRLRGRRWGSVHTAPAKNAIANPAVW